MPAPEYTSVVRRRSGDSVVDQIEELIVAHKLNPGDPLPPERELAARLSVSRNVLRESLGVLSQRGLVTVVPGRGTFVAEPSATALQDSLRLLLRLRNVDLLDLCDARLLIEPHLAALAAQRRAESDIAPLESAFERLMAAGDDDAHVQADLAFHDEIAALADQPVLRAMVEAVRESVTVGMIVGSSVPSAPHDSDEQHARVYRAIISGDSDAARAAMTEHIEFVRQYITEHATLRNEDSL